MTPYRSMQVVLQYLLLMASCHSKKAPCLQCSLVVVGKASCNVIILEMQCSSKYYALTPKEEKKHHTILGTTDIDLVINEEKEHAETPEEAHVYPIKKHDNTFSTPTSMSTITTASSSETSHYHSLQSILSDNYDDDHSVVRVVVDDSPRKKEKEEEDAVLLLQMWGREDPPPPSHVSPLLHSSDSRYNGQGETTLTTLLASCPCPIDVDEDAFVVDSVVRLQGVHNVIAEAIKLALLEDALVIFEKMMRGLRGNYWGALKRKKEPHRFIGSTLHNMGVVYLWAGRYEVF
mmetsp:Transcript_37179/g.55611  ORF Transcript_37179/g.55611 Transcript_37179/m.55611 type:complete len:290 (-) Transcript_37179:2943-3812(-)